MRTTAKTSSGDAVTAHELALYAVNDAVLYRRQAQPIIKRLAWRKSRGDYDHAKALVLWGYLAESAAKAYHQEFCYYPSSPIKWHHVFPSPVRKLAAQEIAEHYADELSETASNRS